MSQEFPHLSHYILVVRVVAHCLRLALHMHQTDGNTQSLSSFNRAVYSKRSDVVDQTCARCHRRIDPFGFALESFDAIGRYRQKDLVNQPVDARVRLPDGTTFSGLSGLRSYLLNERREDFVRQFCRKLLGYSLGRAVQLSDQPLLEQMQRELRDNDYRIWTALEAILRSRQFRFHRGLEATRETPL